MIRSRSRRTARMIAPLPAEIGREVVGRRAELRLLLSALERGKAILLLGLPGVSKTTMVRALARRLGEGDDHFVDATGDEQLTAHALVGGFDPPMVLKDGYRPEHFVPGPLTRAMRAGGVLYVEELNRAPSGALNALLTALSDRYTEVPRLGRIDARPFLGCSAYAGKIRLKPNASRRACQIVHELIDTVLRRDYQGSVEVLLERAAEAPMGAPAASEDMGDSRPGEEGETTLAGGG